jgi:hypothetical protein
MVFLHFIVKHPLVDAFLAVSIWSLYRLLLQPSSEKPPTEESPIELSKQDYGTPCMTIRGERVRSVAECFIANYLNTCGVEYAYEEPFLINTNSGKIKLYPDFYLPEFDLLVEYWGLVDCNSDYEQEMRWKMAHYHRNQMRFISIYPSNLLYPFDPVDFDKLFRYKFQQTTGTALRPLARENLSAMPRFRIIRQLESRRLAHSVSK